MKYLVFGLGISGKSVVKYLLAKGEKVIGVDQRKGSIPGIEVFDENVSIEGIDCLILSPGIPRTHPLVCRAKEKKIEVISEVAFAFKYLKNKCIGITGSNGKTTTTLLVTHILNQCGIAAKAVGNVGISLSSCLIENKGEVLVVELSSFQLEELKGNYLDYAIILNISDNHLDRYLSYCEYVNAKLSIHNCLKEGGLFFAPIEIIDKYFLKALPFENGAFAICQQFGITIERFSREAKSFIKPPHRLEKVVRKDGSLAYNDSKSTSVASTLYAVTKLEGPLVIIVGGKDKGLNYLPWDRGFKGKVRYVVAYGEAKEKIAEHMPSFPNLIKIACFEEAVKRALELANSEDMVLLSPGCSSYDQFENFEQRGNAFKKIILG